MSYPSLLAETVSFRGHNGDQGETWVKQASLEQLNAVCEALLNFYAATEREHGRQTKPR